MSNAQEKAVQKENRNYRPDSDLYIFSSSEISCYTKKYYLHMSDVPYTWHAEQEGVTFNLEFRMSVILNTYRFFSHLHIN